MSSRMYLSDFHLRLHDRRDWTGCEIWGKPSRIRDRWWGWAGFVRQLMVFAEDL
jgi:hypothetical protein